MTRDDEPCADDGNPEGAAASGDGAIPAPFDAMPTIEDPSESERRAARNELPPQAVPDTGAIPDPRYQWIVEQPLTVPAWGMAATRWRLSHANPDDVDRAKVEGILMEYAAIREQFRTPDGRDAVAVLLDEVGHGDV